jgi:hypothetical protein
VSIRFYITSILFVGLLTFNFKGYAQLREVPINLPKYDKQPIHFGFLLGYNSANFSMQLDENFKLQDSVYSISPYPQGGLNLGILSNLRIGEHFDLRFMPALSFVQRKLEYDFYYPSTSQSPVIVKTVESTYLELPVNLKFKSARLGNYRLYVVAGGRTSIDMISQAKVVQKDPDILKLKRKDYGLELGLGADFYMPYFKFSPEIKMYHGLPNLLVDESTVYVNPLQSLKSKIFFVSFFFE